jgi:hypothetical protein
VVSTADTVAFRLCDFRDLTMRMVQPLIDVVLMGRIHQRLAMPADESENLDALFHDLHPGRFGRQIA